MLIVLANGYWTLYHSPFHFGIPAGNIQVSWIDNTSAFVSLSQTDQVQIGEFDMPAKYLYQHVQTSNCGTLLI